MTIALGILPPQGSTLLGIFAKHWEPGVVKTRLGATIGAERAAEVHRAFVETLLGRFPAVAQRCRLAFTPRDKEAALRAVLQNSRSRGWEFEPQAEGDLGQRMNAFFRTGLEQAQRVVLIGSDSPDLPRHFISQAFELLAERDLVLGPAADGGYYLVGVSNRLPPIFEDIPWSTPEVWRRTIERLQATATRWHTLPPWYDVDDEASLTQLLSSLRLTRERDLHLATLDERLREILGALVDDLAGE